MDLEPFHHLLLLRKLTHHLCHVFQSHLRCVCLGSVDDALNLFINIVERLQEMHVAQFNPQLILVIQMNYLIFNFNGSICIDSILDIDHIRLVKEIVHHR